VGVHPAHTSARAGQVPPVGVHSAHTSARADRLRRIGVRCARRSARQTGFGGLVCVPRAEVRGRTGFGGWVCIPRTQVRVPLRRRGRPRRVARSGWVGVRIVHRNAPREAVTPARAEQLPPVGVHSAHTSARADRLRRIGVRCARRSARGGPGPVVGVRSARRSARPTPAARVAWRVVVLRPGRVARSGWVGVRIVHRNAPRDAVVSCIGGSRVWPPHAT
jgi:hypothetical protein